MAEDIVKKDAKLKRITWKTRHTRLETNWEGFRETLFSDALSKEALPPSVKCSVCNCDLQQCVQCIDCGPSFFVCSKCDMDTHNSDWLSGKTVSIKLVQSNIMHKFSWEILKLLLVFRNLFMLRVRVLNYGYTPEVWRARKMRKSSSRDRWELL